MIALLEVAIRRSRYQSWGLMLANLEVACNVEGQI
jgi:hypothetical protein